MEFTRIIQITNTEEDSIFLWGPRQIGKSTLLKRRFPDAIYYDLLKSDECDRLRRKPSLLREEVLCQSTEKIIIIDEVQKIPALLDEVHWLICNHGYRFILCGSSARKLKAAGTKLLGGRALKCEMFPLVSAEVGDIDLLKAINDGMIPRHYLAADAKRRLQAYIAVYLEEEIRHEAQLRNLGAFNRFLEVAAGCDSEIVNYTNIAQDCGVSATTVKEYFSILDQTLIGFMLPAFAKSNKRRIVQAPKFYYFDVGVANYLRHVSNITPGSTEFGHALEHFVIQEIRAWLAYSYSDEKLSYWRTSSGIEVDCIVGNARVAIEIKSVTEIQPRHLKGLQSFGDDYPSARKIAVSLDKNRRLLNGIEIIPVKEFLNLMWSDGL